MGKGKDGVGEGRWGEFFRIEGRVREHSCLPAQVSKRDPSHMAGPCDGMPRHNSHKCKNLSQPLATELTVDLGRKEGRDRVP